MTQLRERRYLIRRPRVLQYFHKGQLRKVLDEERVAGRFELFFDLLCNLDALSLALKSPFLTISRCRDSALTKDATDSSINAKRRRSPILLMTLRKRLQERTWSSSYLCLLQPGIFADSYHDRHHILTIYRNAWADAKEYANNYFNDDMLQRAGVIWIMTLLVIYGNNAVYVAQDLGALRATVGSYMVLRFSQICFYAVSSVASHHHRAQNRAYFALMLVGICIWIPLLCENVSDHAKIVAAVVAILYEVSCPGFPRDSEDYLACRTHHT